MALARLGRDQRGGAVVELMLSGLLLVPMVLYGLYLADALEVGMRAQQAAVHALWDVTGYKLHDYKSGDQSGQLLRKAAKDAGDDTQQKYAKLDVYHPGKSLPMLTLDPPSLEWAECQVSDGIPQPTFTFSAGGRLHQSGGVVCQAQAQIQANKQIPVTWSFGWGDKDLFSKVRQMKLCGVGLATGGQCAKDTGFSVLTDDWGVDDGKVNENDKGNAEYDAVARAMYEEPPGGTALDSAAAMAAMPILGAPLPTPQFVLFYEGSGASSQHKRPVPTDQGTDKELYTTPFDDATGVPYATSESSWTQHEECYLGLKCP